MLRAMEQLIIPLPADVAARLRQLAADRGEAVEDFAGDVLAAWATGAPGPDGLTDAQAAELRRRLAAPEELVDDAEMDAFITQLTRD
jgi:plasmid stability protein